MASSDIIFDYVSPEDLPCALKIEQEGYPLDEAATEDSFRLRQSQAGNLFLGAYQQDGTSRVLVAFICSTLSSASSLTHESMSEHVPGGSSVCIHSVCVSSDHRRKGIGLALIEEYIARLERGNTDGSWSYRCLLLITHDHLRGFYEHAGFKWSGKSNVVHGSKPWYEMRRELQTGPFNTAMDSPQNFSSQTQQLQHGILAALQRRPNTVHLSRLLSDFPNGIPDLTNMDREGVLVNKFDLLCPKANCGSIILKKGVGMWAERSSIQLQPSNYPIHPDLPPLPVPSETAQWWLINGSPMSFENIGFTHPVQPLTTSGQRLKLLACAECDLGPLGWSEEGGSEYWLACSRVGYGG